MVQATSSAHGKLDKSDPNVVDNLWRLKKYVEKEFGCYISFSMLMNNTEYLQNVLKKADSSSSAQLRKLSQSAKKFVHDARVSEQPRRVERIKKRSQLPVLHERAKQSDLNWSQKRSLWVAYGVAAISVLCALVIGFYSLRPASHGPAEVVAEAPQVRSPDQQPALATNSSSEPVNKATAEPEVTHQSQLESANALPLNELDEQSLPVKELFSLAGSNTVGEKLGPALVRAWLGQKYGNSIELSSESEGEHSLISGETSNERVHISLEAKGSSSAFKSILSGAAQVGMASRRIKASENEKLMPSFGDLTSQNNEHIIALDGLAVITHPQNSVRQLTMGQLAKVFSGEVTHWRQLGGDPDLGRIQVYVRAEGSGTRDTFVGLVLKPGRLKFDPEAIAIESSSELSDTVAREPAAIGFIGLPYIGRSQAMAIASTADTLPVYPTKFTVSTEDYPLARRLYFYSTDDNDPVVSEFIDFTLSEQGQKVVREIGLVSQIITASRIDPKIEYPDRYNDLVKMAQRLSLNFRFNSGDAQLDNKGVYDLNRLTKYMEEHENKRVILVGFSDSTGEADANLVLSERRAYAIEHLLSMRGVPVMNVMGMGESVPVSSNVIETGRNKNRRVEIWVI